MITPKFVREDRVVIGPCLLSYVHLFAKYEPKDGGDGKYMANVLIPKSETETINALNQAIEAAKKAGIVSKWGGKLPKKLDMPLRDGNEKDDAVYEDCLFVNAKSNNRVSITDKNNVPIVDEEEVYSGMYAFVSVSFYPYDKNGNRGIACSLNGIKKYKDGERLGGGGSGEADLADIDMEDDDDL